MSVMDLRGYLSDTVRERTRMAHEQAESRPFIVGLMSGGLDVRSYVNLIGGLAPVYDAMETHLRSQADNPSISRLDDRRLDRYARMVADLSSFGQVADRPDQLRASAAYARAVEAAAQSPQRLLAHHYTRYLGDLSGGRAIARSLHNHYGVPVEQLSFYDFSELGDVVPYRRHYKQQLDTMPWTEGEKQEFVDEALLAFGLNADLFDELSAEGAGSSSGAGSFLRAELVHLPR
jgi:heme oxygenase